MVTETGKKLMLLKMLQNDDWNTKEDQKAGGAESETLPDTKALVFVL